jgi:hypothetical protein
MTTLANMERRDHGDKDGSRRLLLFREIQLVPGGSDGDV